MSRYHWLWVYTARGGSSISSHSSSSNAVLFRCHWLDISYGANHPWFSNPTSKVCICPRWNFVARPGRNLCLCLPHNPLSESDTRSAILPRCLPSFLRYRSVSPAFIPAQTQLTNFAPQEAQHGPCPISTSSATLSHTLAYAPKLTFVPPHSISLPTIATQDPSLPLRLLLQSE